MKKLLSLLLAVLVLAGSFVMALPALADGVGINLVLNGGTLTGSANLSAGDALPNYEGVTKTGATFGGWYTTEDFQGTQSFTAAADTTYYARWVVHDVDVTDFESYSNTTFVVGNTDSSAFRTWKYPEDGAGDVTLNTNTANAYSGNNSAKLVLDNTGTDGKCLDFGDIAGHRWWDSADKVEDGFCFWISTDKEVTLKFTTAWSYGTSITVPAGKHIITLPETWGVAYDSKFIFNVVEGGATVYLDDIGTFTNIIYQSSVTLEANGGTIDPTVQVEGGSLLPNYEKVTKENATFGGWYKNADFSGAQVFVAEADTTYYARWIKHEVTVTDFEGWDNTTFSTNVRVYNQYHSNKSASAVLDTNSANAYSGSNSAKIYVSWDDDGSGNVLDFGDNSTRWYNNDNIKEGVCFWMSTDQAVTFKVQWWTNVICTVSVPAGKHIITIPNVTGYNYNFKLVFQKPGGPRPTIYIDDIGSFTTLKESKVTLEKNGGTLVDPTAAFAAGDTLPTFEEITKENAIFGGWYADELCMGDRVYTVANNGDTYYAKWLTVIETLEDFESATDTTGWYAWTGASSAYDSHAINTDAANAFSGSKSLKVVTKNIKNISGLYNQKAVVATFKGFSSASEGLYFYIDSKYETQIEVNLNSETDKQTGYTSGAISVPIGRSLITIPWSKFGANITQSTAYVYSFMIKGRWSNDGTSLGEVYIDDIGSYQEVKTGIPVSFETNGGTWAQGYTAPERVATGMALPTYENLSKNDATFAGWYLNADFSGERVYTVPSTIADNQTFYAYWVVHNVNGTDFESDTVDTYDDVYYFWTGVSGTNQELNTDSAFANSGNNSAKITLKVKSGSDQYNETDWGNDIPNDWWAVGENLGDGICFWIYTDKDLSFKIRSDAWDTSEETIYVSAGKHFVTIPKAVFHDRRKHIFLRFTNPNEEATVYIDDMGTYTSNTNLDIKYNLNGGSFVEGVSYAQKIGVSGETVLPTEAQVQKEGWYFAGWYDNAELTGVPVYFLTTASGREVWAKWVEQLTVNYDFESMTDAQSLTDDYWKDSTKYDAPDTEDPYDGWRPFGGGFSVLDVDTDAANLAPDSTKSLRGEYTIYNGGYITQGKETPSAVFRRYLWTTTFGTRSVSREGDGYSFWIKSDRTVTMSVIYLKDGDPKLERKATTVTVPANVGVRVYLPWTTLDSETKQLSSLGFIFYGNIGDTGKVWIDDLGIYYDEKIVPFVQTNDDGDIKVSGYNNHIPKGTNVQIDKYSVSELTAMGGSLPTGASMAYLAEYNLRNAEGGLTTLYGNAWVSFKLPAGADTSKIGVYEVFFDGSLTPVNYTFEGNWITTSTLNANAVVLVTLNDTAYTAKGLTIDENLVQPLTKTTTTTVIVDDGTEGSDDGSQNAVTEPETDNDTDTDSQTGANRRPMREPLKSDNDATDTTSGGFPWWIILVICAGVLVIAAVIIIPIAVKRRRERN